MPQIDKVNSVLRFELSLCVGCMDGGAITPVVCNVGQDDCFISFCFADQNSLCLLLFEYVQLPLSMPLSMLLALSLSLRYRLRSPQKK